MGRVACKALATLALALAGSARAGPVTTDVQLVVQIADERPIVFTGSGTVTVSGDTVHVPAGLISATSIPVPVSAVSAYYSPLRLNNLSNQAGVFRPDGVATQAPSEICPGSGNAAAGFACNVGGGVGGVMALEGTLVVPVVPPFITIPHVLSDMHVGVGGAATNLPFAVDAAAWSTGPGRIGTANASLTPAYGNPSGLTLVTPIFLRNSPFNDGWGDLIPVTATLWLADVQLVPEPTSIVLVAVGVAGLLLVRRDSP